MQFCLLEGFYAADSQSISVGFHHDLFTYISFELEYLHEHFDDMLHGIHVIVMENDLVERDMCSL